MEFLLVRHGDAKTDAEDARRPLSDRGRMNVEKIARAAAAKRADVAEILHSGKLRAQETAAILARLLSPAGGVHQTPGLAPEDDPFVAKAELELADAPLILVGHLPHLDRLAALLVQGDCEKKVVEFSPATMACFARTTGKWRLAWILSPGEL